MNGLSFDDKERLEEIAKALALIKDENIKNQLVAIAKWETIKSEDKKGA